MCYGDILELLGGILLKLCAVVHIHFPSVRIKVLPPPAVLSCFSYLSSYWPGEEWSRHSIRLDNISSINVEDIGH
jgi:hypothetical protein